MIAFGERHCYAVSLRSHLSLIIDLLGFVDVLLGCLDMKLRLWSLIQAVMQSSYFYLFPRSAFHGLKIDGSSINDTFSNINEGKVVH